MFEAFEYVEKNKSPIAVVNLSLQELRRLCHHYKLPHFVVDGERAKIKPPENTKKPFKLHFTSYDGILIRAFEG